MEELDAVLKKLKTEKTASFDEIPPKVWKTRKFDVMLLWLCNVVYKRNATEKWKKRLHTPHFLKKGDLGITKNYWSTLCTLRCYFQYNSTMRSPLRGVLACIYLEFLESGPFKYINPDTAYYFRYIDDILLIYPQDLDLQSITDRLNNAESSYCCHLCQFLVFRSLISLRVWTE